MPLPAETQQLIEYYLEKIKANPKNDLSSYERFTIYKSFGILARVKFEDWGKQEEIVLQQADKVLNWLALMTARKVSPIWDEEYPNSGRLSPAWILSIAERYLTGNVTKEAVKRLNHNVFSNWEPTDEEGKIYWVVQATYEAFLIATTPVLFSLGNYTGPEATDYDDEENEEENYGKIAYSDFVKEAIKAYSFVEYNDYAIFSLKKRLEFWEWWLTEAIPKAWEFAEDNK